MGLREALHQSERGTIMPDPITLTVMDGSKELFSKTFTQTTIKVGRISSAQLRVDHESVARMHGYLQHDQYGTWYSDLGSAGGSYLNGQRINKAQLKTGDRLGLGGADIVVLIQIGNEAAKPQPEPQSAETDKRTHKVLERLQKFTQAFSTEEQSPETPQKVYYCEICFHHHGQVIEMDQDEGSYQCRHCGSRWKLNQGQARHLVGLKLRQYRRLAQLLGMHDE